MRLWPDSLAGRTLALLIGMTLLLIIGSAILLHKERNQRFDERNRFQLLERVATLVPLLNDTSEDERRRIVQRIARQGKQIVLSDQPQVTGPPSHPLERRISRRLQRVLGIEEPSRVRVRIEFGDTDEDDHEKSIDRSRHARVHDLEGVDISIRLQDGGWINMRTEKFQGPPPWAIKTLQLLALLLTLLVVSGLIIARRMARPMAQLADAADRFGLGHSQSPLEEKGPREVRQTIRAFNRMQARLHKHITERSHMLAAVSHDLRTPITTLRLRAEYIDDQEMREKTLATLTEMEAILSAALSFARDEAADEKARATDLAALLQSLVDDHADQGGDASYQGPDKLVFICRPVALRRALNNLIDNALKYGKAARVQLVQHADRVEILIDDDGPGIPPESLEDVFTPFYRLEASRNRDTGGTGLGLAVARTVVLAHGGELDLGNRAEAGLRARVRLPQR